MSTARRRVVGESDSIVLIEAVSDLVGKEVLRGSTDDEEEMIGRIVEVYENSIKETLKRSYTVKIDEYMVNVATSDDVISILNASVNKYVPEGTFDISLQSDPEREIPVLVPKIERNEQADEDTGKVSYASDFLTNSGFYGVFDEIVDNTAPEVEVNLDDYKDVDSVDTVSFVNNVEVVQAYLPSRQVTPTSQAIDEVTKDKEQKTIYEVVAGDTLSGIANKTGISIDQIIELNEDIKNVNSIIRIGDEITVTVPQPELSVRYEELKYYEGSYEAPIEYKYNDSWYSTKQVTLQDPSSGYRKAVMKTVYENTKAISTEVVMEEVVAEAIPKIVEKGTKIPPTYIKPLSGGVITSGFGSRTVLFKGMTSYHRAIDWGCRTGTTIFASCGGTVTHAGWMSSYGYCVFIKHPDGRETRYAHLSRVLCSKGDVVAQGQKIGLSGMTGAANGPHLHFEMRINGVAVNPLNYISN
ncbi:MAG: peptidoglycan DD-metalloendopeptidase family protein [Lachnospiraceae bacterium]|nr:peptidoglycan DD-metalloendopeptidase family protein [Lachnospiraceae bacterium]